MDAALIFTGITYGLAGLLWITAFVLLWISIRKERSYGQPIKGLVAFTVAIVGLCAFIFLFMAYVKAMSLEKVPHHVETVTAKDESQP